MRDQTAVELTRELIRFDTSNPGRIEGECAGFMARRLEAAGMSVELIEVVPGRPHVAAWLPARAGHVALCMCSHIDVVPAGQSEWKRPPFAGELSGGMVHGRGASDTKSSVAAMMVAGMRLAREPGLESGLLLLMTADEESGNTGIRALADSGRLAAKAGAIVVGEPTSCVPAVGHKGVLWLDASASGRTAHGSMPELGDNAVYKAAEAVLRMRDFDFRGACHPLMGRPTVNIGVFAGGERINSVPDSARLEIDIRTVAGQRHDLVLADARRTLGPGIEARVRLDAAPLFSDPADPWVSMVFDVVEKISSKRPEPKCLSYFTDGSVLQDMMGRAPAVILGPGEPGMAHKTDERCDAGKIEQAAEIYFDIALNSCINKPVSNTRKKAANKPT